MALTCKGGLLQEYIDTQMKESDRIGIQFYQLHGPRQIVSKHVSWLTVRLERKSLLTGDSGGVEADVHQGLTGMWSLL